MNIVPNTPIGKITFYEAHIAKWTTRAAQIGLSSADCTALAALIEDARKAFDEQQVAMTASKSSTMTMQNAVRAMHALGAADIAKIKAFAEATDDPNVYPLADIPAPASPSPVGPPGTPTDFTVGLEQTGAVTLRWKCPNPPGSVGTVYEVRRRVGPAGSFGYLGSQGTRVFTDDTLPAGSTGVTYQITAIRSTSRGPAAQFNVNFGVGGDGMAFATVTPVGTVKIAA
jgi:hypothetical protein